MKTHRNSKTELSEQKKPTGAKENHEKAQRNECQSPTSRVSLKLGLGWYRHSV